MRHLWIPLIVATHIACESGRDRELVWSDEFEVTGMPDSSKWDYDLGDGCPDSCGW